MGQPMKESKKRVRGEKITKLTPEVIEQVRQLLSEGLNQRTVAGLVGVNPGTLCDWRRQGEDGRGGLYADFLAALEVGRAQAIARNVGIVQRAADSGIWQAAAWWLERTDPENYAKKDHITHAGDPSAPLQITTKWGVGGNGTRPGEEGEIDPE